MLSNAEIWIYYLFFQRLRKHQDYNGRGHRNFKALLSAKNDEWIKNDEFEKEEIKVIAELPYNWEKIKDKTVLISGERVLLARRLLIL